MIQGKKYISPGAWFSLIYPQSWSEFEDGPESFLFYNPDVWTGNFRISATKEDACLRGGMQYGQAAIAYELKENPTATRVQLGELECAYSKEMFEENGTYYTTHRWITGIDNVDFCCTFTLPRGGSVEQAQRVIETLTIRHDGKKYPPEIIPIRLSEIHQINESYQWVATLIKSQGGKEFQSTEQDLALLQQLVDSGALSPTAKEEWLSIGIALCTILVAEVEGMEWMTLIDGNREVPVLQYSQSTQLIDPLKIAWSHIKASEPCHLAQAYQDALTPHTTHTPQ